MDLLPILKGAATFIPGLYSAERGRTGGTISARYCYAVWLRHLTLLNSCGLSTRFESVAELGPGDSLGIGLAALLTGVNTIHALDVVRYARAPANQKILEDLVGLLRQREPIPDANELPAVHPRLDGYSFPKFLDVQHLAASLAPDRLQRIRDAIEGRSSDISVNYFVPWHERWGRSSTPVDFVLSQAVLEHVEELRNVHRNLASGLKVGGLVSHVIDFRSHGLTSGWDGHLQYSDAIWRVVKGRRPYLLNRRSPSEHLEAIETEGFELVKVVRVEAAPITPPDRLSEKFRSWSLTDRTTSTMVVVARRVR